jgi:hypothetical protein
LMWTHLWKNLRLHLLWESYICLKCYL